ncbi:MAG TPA: helix-turn-helix domain-containing protein [Mesorhizobium sp.]|jgi:chromosomal replication initiation ATPase DnaA|uniref:helix-turn-helix domain-containing protein n=1 Tax=Mesorhizobium sp. TaxID=1871066 RepID=UPI002DDCC2DC|nr:helix-turn-helix domain-containing protein [Mesorhizobium sp.]HEV2502351.1 helix-turn-helix domain-containing protein [Mesorhizobium sp.]
MAEPGMRKLDQGLPRIDMYSPEFRARQALRRQQATIVPDTKATRAELAKDALSLLDDAREKADVIVAEAREEAARILAEAAEQVATIFADARTTADLIVDRLDASQKPRVTVREIIREMADRFDVRPEDITGACRTRIVVKARWAAMVAAHHARPDLSTIALGREFDRDHTAVIYALRKSGVRPMREKV